MAWLCCSLLLLLLLLLLICSLQCPCRSSVGASPLAVPLSNWTGVDSPHFHPQEAFSCIRYSGFLIACLSFQICHTLRTEYPAGLRYYDTTKKTNLVIWMQRVVLAPAFLNNIFWLERTWAMSCSIQHTLRANNTGTSTGNCRWTFNIQAFIF